jgi:hypothetical protein
MSLILSFLFGVLAGGGAIWFWKRRLIENLRTEILCLRIQQ